jgi:Fungal specific transcription factor domain/Fungal Zn(2)-Cys(6) binuclear cluster domain
VKCDEGLPACLRCAKTGRKCDGYEVKVKEEDSLVSVEQHGFLDPITRLPFSFPCDGEQERRAFQFFFTNTTSEIAGFLPSDFWSKLILQASHTDPTILHAVIALGSAHESYGGEAPGHLRGVPITKQFALQQSYKAIRHLRTQISTGTHQSGESVLLSCILFICLETFQGNHEAALAHLESGLKILASWLHDDDQCEPVLNSNIVSRPTRKFLEEELVPLFTRLDVQATTYLTSRSLKEVHPCSSTETPVMPTRFTSLSDANNHLADLVHWMLYSNNGAHNMMYWMVNNPLAQANFRPPPPTPGGPIPKIPKVVLDKIQKIETQHGKILQKWLDGLNLFLKEHPNLEPKDLRGAVMLKILYTSTTIIKAASLYNHDMEYDKYNSQFAQVITMAESLITSQTAARNKNTPMYSFEMNILPPLHYCSTRCRDPKLRRRALALLEDSPRREGMWDSAMLAAIATYVIEQEEAGLGEITSAEEIPASARIYILDKVPMLEERKCVIKYCKGVRNPYAKLDILETLITW